jgi:hypothetical protein
MLAKVELSIPKNTFLCTAYPVPHLLLGSLKYCT